MSEKWTPGPWTHYDDSKNPQHRHVIASRGKTVAHIYCTRGDETPDAANALLIAAAPDMYEALSCMFDRWEPDSDGGQDRLMWERARAALAKARGEARQRPEAIGSVIP